MCVRARPVYVCAPCVYVLGGGLGRRDDVVPGSLNTEMSSRPISPQFWAAGRREWVGNGCSASQPSPNWSRALGLALWQRRGHIPPTVLLYTQDLWRCGFCLVFPESQFGGLCWRRRGKGIQVRQAAFQAMSHWERRLRREHLPQETISLQSHQPRVPAAPALIQSSQAVLPM